MASRAFRRFVLLAAAVAAATAAAYLLIPVPLIRIAHGDTGRVLWRVAVYNGAQVDLNYTNSLFDAPTTERFIVTGGLLRLIEISSTREAVLEYLVLEPPYEQRDGRFISKRRGPFFSELTVRIGQTGQQRLVAGGRELPLYEIGAGEALRITVSRAPRLALLIRGQ